MEDRGVLMRSRTHISHAYENVCARAHGGFSTTRTHMYRRMCNLAARIRCKIENSAELLIPSAKNVVTLTRVHPNASQISISINLSCMAIWIYMIWYSTYRLNIKNTYNIYDQPEMQRGRLWYNVNELAELADQFNKVATPYYVDTQ